MERRGGKAILGFKVPAYAMDRENTQEPACSVAMIGLDILLGRQRMKGYLRERESGSHPGLQWDAQEARPNKPDYSGRDWFQIIKGKEGLEIKVAPWSYPGSPKAANLISPAY